MYKEIKMDTIQNALGNFLNLMNYKYSLIIANKKTIYKIPVTFHDKDFYHLAGFQYLSDIDIPKNPTSLFEKINTAKISDSYLKASVYYEKVDESYTNVKSRIYGLQLLEKYLDNKNIICKYVKYMNRYSSIKADYLITSTVNHKTAYIFLRERKRDDSYCICSFFIESQTRYLGIKAYWLYKSKININTGISILILVLKKYCIIGYHNMCRILLFHYIKHLISKRYSLFSYESMRS